MHKSFLSIFAITLIISGCQTQPDQTASTPKTVLNKDSVANKTTDSLILKHEPCENDSLNAIANVMSGIGDSSMVYKDVQHSSSFQLFSANFNKRWMSFDSSRLTNLRSFRENEIAKVVKKQTTLFYPFSGPDILHAQTFFPDADNYVMIGLEPVGSLPTFKSLQLDSLTPYYNRVNTSLDAILKFSFFRTVSMSKDLKNAEVDGTLHLLFLFLKRTGNLICSAKPVTVDSLGQVVYLNSFIELKKMKSPTKGVEIKFTDKNNQPKTVSYFSLNAADGGIKQNKGFMTYLTNMGTINTYLKGASYLMHKSYFSMVRNVILNQSEHVIQDDSGIAFHYFTESNSAWSYTFYGSYIRPIAMFSAFYQADLDSTYKQQGSKNIGFGIGYNFRDKNSNFMIATKKH
jgi:hypothetical protein